MQTTRCDDSREFYRQTTQLIEQPKWDPYHGIHPAAIEAFLHNNRNHNNVAFRPLMQRLAKRLSKEFPDCPLSQDVRLILRVTSFDLPKDLIVKILCYKYKDRNKMLYTATLVSKRWQSAALEARFKLAEEEILPFVPAKDTSIHRDNFLIYLAKYGSKIKALSTGSTENELQHKWLCGNRPFQLCPDLTYLQMNCYNMSPIFLEQLGSSTKITTLILANASYMNVESVMWERYTQITRLGLIGYWLNELPPMRTTLTDLSLRDCFEILSVEKLYHLKTLSILQTDNLISSNFPTALTKLTIVTGCSLKGKRLPTTLRELNLHIREDDCLPFIPDSVREMKWHFAIQSTVFRVHQFLTHLKIDYFIGVTLIFNWAPLKVLNIKQANHLETLGPFPEGIRKIKVNAHRNIQITPIPKSATRVEINKN